MAGPNTALQELSRWAAALRPGDIPAAVMRHARYVVLDTFGAAIAGSMHPLIRTLGALAPSMTGSPYRLIAEQRRVSMSDALVINGCAAQVHDLDETNLLSQTHAAAAILPALVTMAGTRRVAGMDFLTAFLVGYEVQSAIGRAMAPAHGAEGWHPSATLGCFGAAASLAKLLRLDPSRWAVAMNLAGTQAAGVKATFGSMAKPLHFGKAALNGVLAAIWAEAGISGGADTFAHPAGFAKASSSGFCSPLKIGADWVIEFNSFKTFPCCMECHPVIEAALKLRATVEGHIISVRVRQSTTAYALVGERGVNSGYEAKFSLRYCLAYALVFGILPMTAFDEPIIVAPAVSALISAIEIMPDRELRHLEAEIFVMTDRGETWRQKTDLTSGLGVPRMHESALEEKFVKLAEPVIGASKSLQILASFRDYGALDDVADVFELATRSAPVASTQTEAVS
jgi:2-methylcitrate dehydratase PrpD